MKLSSAVFAAWLTAVGFALVRGSHSPAHTTRDGGGSKYVTVNNGKFTLDGKPFQYIGTSAYWLQLIDNDDDMYKTLHEIASLGVKVVRTWAFNDVSEIPSEGVWLRVFHSNGTIEINTGENGILRLDRIVRVAKQVGIHILFTLTNNWFPNVSNNGTTAKDLDGRNLPRNYLSNDYGGMDTYVKHFSPNSQVKDLSHDIFYTDNKMIDSFKSYAATIVKRYSTEPSVLGWEIANDPRCSSTLPSSRLCKTQTLTKWTANIAQTVKQNDPNHLVATGDAGFYCVECPRVFPRPPPSTPQPSPLPPSQPNNRRRSQPDSRQPVQYNNNVPSQPNSQPPTPCVEKRKGPLTKKALAARCLEWKKRNFPSQDAQRRAPQGPSIRGRWKAPETSLTKRQSNGFGPLYDGSYGVDTEDLVNAPNVDFSSFQFFPDQNTYGPLTVGNAIDFNQVVQAGIDWIEQHAATANTYNKPTTLNGFGLVTSQSANTFAPFNASVPQSSPIGTTQAQQVSAYNTWITSAVKSGVQGIIQYQWGQGNITSSSSSAITHQSGVGTTNSTTTSFYSPNDGYAAYDSAVKNTLAAGAKLIASQNGSGSNQARGYNEL
ncbi:related to beta-mannanase [Serendipita indica DSM 11827]|uniref:mannan endo-1,4-beta-mannosidase n=1 Tax=Serendipita indica (strain DSM 11827) TaxID=1109443 RepID=G4U3B9_SERID|nr:related to beta-mannanase [Serendipita indica DSM 11827]